MLKTVAIKILMLVTILFCLNTVYNFTLFEKDLAEFSKEELEIKRSQAKTDIYYFGESSNITYKLDDSIKTSISGLCNLFFSNLKITNINQYATHAGTYKHWLRQISRKEKKPKAVIITLNMRSFDAAFIHSKLETQLQQSLVLTQPYPNIINRYFLALQAFDNKTVKQREVEMLEEWRTVKIQAPINLKYKTVKEWDDAMANGGYLNADGTWDNKKIELACHYIKGFAFSLDESNPRIKDLDEINLWAQENNVELFLNLMAENVQYADSLVGKELVFLLRANRDFIVNRYNKGNTVVVDNLELVNGNEFVDQNWTTEHYDYKGRMRIAKNLAKKMKEQFETEYKKAY